MRDQYQPDYRTRQIRRDLRKLLPTNQDDVAAVAQLATLGYPAVEPILVDMLKWIRIPVWPVCQPMAAFLAHIGPVMLPAIQQVLRSHDQNWTTQIMNEILAHWPSEAVRPLYNYLEQQAIHGQYGHDLEALDFLIRRRLIERDSACDILRTKRRLLEEQMAQVASLEERLGELAV